MKGKQQITGMVLIVAFISMIGPFSIDAYLPSFPSIEADFLSTRAMLSQTIAIYMIATAISALFWGALSDRFGRRVVIIASLTLYSLASLNCALASNYSEFFLSRVLQGIAASGGLVAGRAMVRDVYNSQDAQRVMAYVLMMFAFAPAIAPVIGGWLHHLFGWRSVFYFLGLYGLIMLIVAMVSVQESLPDSHRQSFHPLHVIKNYFRTLKHLRFLFLVMALAISFSGLFVYIAGAPALMFDVLHLQSRDFWMLFVPITTGIVLGSFLSGKLIRSWTAKKVINMAFSIMAIAAVLNLIQFSFLELSVTMVVIPVMIYAFGVAMSMPGLAVLALDCFPDNKGVAAAMQSFMQIMISGLVAGLLVPLLRESVIMFVAAQMFFLVIALVLWRLSNIRGLSNVEV